VGVVVVRIIRHVGVRVGASHAWQTRGDEMSKGQGVCPSMGVDQAQERASYPRGRPWLDQSQEPSDIGLEGAEAVKMQPS
jgi:hypothetical protein